MCPDLTVSVKVVCVRRVCHSVCPDLTVSAKVVCVRRRVCAQILL